jgi:hypothetical protein
VGHVRIILIKSITKIQFHVHIGLYLVFDIAKAGRIMDIVLVNICMLLLYYVIFFLILSRTLHKSCTVMCKFRYNTVLNKESLYLHGD